MHAIIIPLNKFFYNYEKYDGTTAPQRFLHSHPRIDKIWQTKVIMFCILILVCLPLFIFYFFPVLIWHSMRLGFDKGVDKFGDAVNRFIKVTSKPPFQRKNLNAALDIFRYRKYNFFVFYTDAMIPKNETEKQEYFIKLEGMKNNLKIVDVFYAKNKISVENIISKYNIDVGKSFFMSEGKIDLSHYPQLEESKL